MNHLLKNILLLLIGIAIGVCLAIAIASVFPVLGGSAKSSVNESKLNVATQYTRDPEEMPTGITDSAPIVDIQAILDLKSPFSRKAALVGLLAKTDQNGLLEILSYSNEIKPPSRREEIQTAAFQRLASINPETAFREIQKTPQIKQDELLKSVFQEWSSTNLDLALVRAEKLPGWQRNSALSAILQSRDDLSENERLQIAQQLGNVDLAKTLLTNEALLEHSGSPNEKWELIVNDDVDDSDQVESLIQVVQLWSNEIGLEVLTQIHEEFREDFDVYSTLIQSLTNDDPQGALDFLVGVELEQRELVGRVVVRSWARSDPIAALNALKNFEPPSLSKSFERDLAYVWARTRPLHLVKNANLLTPLERVRSLQTALRKIAQTSPEDALNQLALISESIDNTSSITQGIIYVWSEQDPQSAVDWILSNYTPEDPERSDLLPDALGKLSLEDPIKAIGLALEEPLVEDRQPPEYRIIWEMSWYADLEETVELLSQIRPDPRTGSNSYAFGLVGSAFIRNEQPDNALELALELPQSIRGEYYRTIAWDWAYANPTQLYERLEDLNDANAKSQFARALMSINELYSVLNDEQIALVQSYVQEAAD